MTLKHPDEYSFLDPKLQKCPFEFYRSLREHAPVYREPSTGYYLVSRYQDLMEVKRNPAKIKGLTSLPIRLVPSRAQG